MSSESLSTILTTARCTLRPAVVDDESALCAAAAPAGDTSRIPRLLTLSDKWWAQYRYGLWVVLNSKDRILLGWCGLRPGESPLNPEIFYGLAPSAQGKGIASEAARAVVQYTLSLPGIESVWAATRSDHTVSAAVMQRIGMVFERRGNLDGVDSVVYRIRRSME